MITTQLPPFQCLRWYPKTVYRVVEKINRLLSMADFLVIFNLYKECCKEDKVSLKVFYNSYLEMMEVVMNSVQATTEENWALLLECI